MKNFSPGLLEFLKNTNSYNRADLFAITCGYPQNLLAQSAALQSSPWTPAHSGGTSNPTVTGNAAVAPDGTTTASSVAFPSVANTSGYNSYLYQFATLLAGSNTFTGSVWLKGSGTISIQISDDVSQDLQIPITLTSSWTRYSLTFTFSSSASTQVGFVIVNPQNSPSVTVYAWGAQLEWARSMGVYVPTLTNSRGPLGPRSPVIYATSSQIDVAYQGVNFSASANGSWERGKVTAETSFDLRANDMTLTVTSPSTVLFPNTISTSYMAAAQLGLFDAAFVQVWTAYWPIGQSPNPSINAWGVETKYAGYIKPDGSITRSKIEFEVADVLYLLNLPVPKHVIQASCRHTLYDLDEFNLYGTRTNCTLNPASFSATNSVAAGSTVQYINLTTPVTASVYGQGFITMTSGENIGLTFYIKTQNSTTNILLGSQMPLLLAVGDTFIMYQGCDKTQVRCTALGNLIHYGGMPYVPDPETAI